MEREVGIYKIEKQKRVRVKVRTGPWYGIRVGDHVRGKFCFFNFAFFLLLFSLRGIMKEMN